MNAAVHFGTFALKNIRIDQDKAGLFARVPDASGKYMTVRCVEGKSSVHASHCNCPSFARHQHCTHIETVARYYGRFYAAPVKKVRKTRNGGLVLVKAPKQTPVAKVIEQAVEAVVPTPKKDMMSASLYSNKGFSILR